MPEVDVRTVTGDAAGTATLDAELFGIEPNMAVLHQVVTAQLAAARSGSHSTLTRAEVAGGGAKPWRQKGSGRARQGSIRAPQWTGGGIAMGPKPRSYKQRTPKKMIQLALRSALSDRAAEDRVAVVDRWEFSAPKTKDAKAALEALDLQGKVLIVLAPDDESAAKSFRNLPGVHVLAATQLNAYDVLWADWVVFTRDTLPGAGPAGEDKAAAPQVAQTAAPADEPPETPPDAGDEVEGPIADALAALGDDDSASGGDDEEVF